MCTCKKTEMMGISVIEYMLYPMCYSVPSEIYTQDEACFCMLVLRCINKPIPQSPLSNNKLLTASSLEKLDQATMGLRCQKEEHLGDHILVTESLFVGHLRVWKCGEEVCNSET
jgi:hypothetical protein